MAREPQKHAKEDINNARQAAREYIGDPKPFQRPKNFKKQLKEDWGAVKEGFEKRPPVDRNQKRTSNMPGSPKNQEFAGGKRDTASQFSKSYDQAGIQPSSLTDKSPKKTNAEQQTQAAQPPPPPPPVQRGLVKPGAKTSKKRGRLKKRGVAKRSLAKVRVTAVNVWLWAWGGWFWLFFQVPFAIMSIIFMALTEVLYSYFVTYTQLKATDPTLWDRAMVVAGKILTVFAAAAAEFLKVFDIDIADFQPANFFMLTHLVVFFLGILTLMLCYIQYKIAFINPLGGQKMSMKMGALMLAIICYSIPILNLFPWFFVWTFVVWMYPK
tara:strand:- start:2038 stop:3012 length:975 start_codon:yes stop_codon:yes gene_type:complete